MLPRHTQFIQCPACKTFQADDGFIGGGIVDEYSDGILNGWLAIQLRS